MMPKAGPKASTGFRSDTQAVFGAVANWILVSQRLTDALSVGLLGVDFHLEIEKFKKVEEDM